MKHIAGYTVGMLLAIFISMLFTMSVGLFSAEAAESNVTFTVE